MDINTHNIKMYTIIYGIFTVLILGILLIVFFVYKNKLNTAFAKINTFNMINEKKLQHVNWSHLFLHRFM